MNRMDPEDEAGKPGTGNVQPHQQPPHKQRVCSLQKNINGVIAGCVANKKMMLGPKYGIGNREVICRSSNTVFWTEHHLFVGNATGYHAVNVLLQAAKYG